MVSPCPPFATVADAVADGLGLSAKLARLTQAARLAQPILEDLQHEADPLAAAALAAINAALEA